MSNTKNYFAHGGNELVTTVEGGEGLFDLPAGSPVTALPFLADSEATTVAGLREDYNRLLAALRTAGLMAQEAGDP